MPGALLEPGQRPEHRLVLCFDGTGNDYQARPNDTNIIKILEMFDRSAPNQMHYYQPGIGTYTADSSVNQSYLGAMKSNISKTIDTGLGTSFDHHVMAGYRFLMRYHMEKDRIYIFGFSRGAFTARFLARMIAHVGLLSMGNEEMVPFAYKLYQDYEMDSKTWGKYMIRFRNAFCRHNSNEDKFELAEGGFKCHFLGLFDTVSSVGTLERGTIRPPLVLGTSRYVRHAVAIDERRVKFKAALLAQDEHVKGDNFKEVWFPGNHGDVGGGWHPEEEPDPKSAPGFLRRFWNSLQRKNDNDNIEINIRPEHDKFQLSDIALKWMIDEIQDAERQALKLEHVEELKGRTDALSWSDALPKFLKRYARHRKQAMHGKMHDTMAFGGGSKFGKILLWNFMEYLPGIWRYEYYNNVKDYSWWTRMLLWIRRAPLPAPEWQKTYFPLNMGGCRDLVAGSLVHHSVLERRNLYSNYSPQNEVFNGPNSTSAASTHRLFEAELHPMKSTARRAPSNPVYFKEQPDWTIGDHPTDMIYSLEVK